MYSRRAVWAPSPADLFREVPKAVDQAEIDEIVAGYACRRALCRGRVRRHRAPVRTPRSCAVSSSATNRRTDGYGGSLEHRSASSSTSSARCGCVIGNRLALGVRLCGDELIDGGTTIDDAVRVAELVEATGQVDYINTSIGVATATPS